MIYLMVMHMNNVSILMLVMDIIPNYNYYHLFYFRGVYNPSNSRGDVNEVFEMPDSDVSDVP